MGLTALRRIQIGAQGDIDTAAAATHIMHVSDSWVDDKSAIITPRQAVGRMVPPTRSYVGSYYAEIGMESDATYEELPYILEAAIKLVSPSNPGTGTGYLYDYDFPISAQNTIRYYTVEGGDDQQEYEASGCFVRNFELSWAAPSLPGGDGVWHYTSLWGGRQVSKDTFTGSLNVTAIETIGTPTVYLDTTLANIGITPMEATVLGVRFTWNEVNSPIPTADGQRYYTYTKQDHYNNPPQMQLVLEHDAFGEAAYDAWLGGTQAAIQAKSEGTTLTGTYSKKTFQLDFYGTPVGGISWGSQLGDNTITVTYESRYYDTTTDLAGQILVVNALSALP